MIHILNYGMGVESSAILTRWLLEAQSRAFNLSELLVLTAQTGDEFPDTQHLVETYIFPLLQQNQIRFVEVARAGASVKDGYTVLQDSRHPTQLLIKGDYPLSENLIAAGTVPRLGRPHLCAIRFKGDVLDAWIGDHIQGGFGSYIGYNAEETSRAQKSNDYGCRGEHYQYPLIEWGWSRETCQTYLHQVFGVIWKKSCCTFCPFQSKATAITRYREQPEAGAFALWVGGLALALNPRMHLFSSGSAYDLCVEGGCQEAITLYHQRLEREEFGLYRVRRIYSDTGTTARTKVNARRSVERLIRGERWVLEAQLAAWASSEETETETTGDWLRYYRYRKGQGYPALEEFLVVCPAAIQDKCQNRQRFEADWQKLSGSICQLRLF